MRLDFGPLLAILFPPSDDELVLLHTDQTAFNSKYELTEMHGGILALASFKDPQVRAAVHLVKFHAHKRAALLLATLLKRYLASLPEGNTYLVVPIPLSSKRQRERGYNQASVIARGALSLRFALCPNALRRTRHTLPQTSLKKHDRMKNMAGAFTVVAPMKLVGQHVILVDDVATTGSTLREAKKALAFAKVASLRTVAIAH